MDLPRLTLLNRLSFHISAERERFLYLVQERSSGKLFAVSRPMMTGLRKLAGRVGERASANEPVTDDEVRAGYGFLHAFQTLSEGALAARKPFNPVFMSIELLDAGRLQSKLAPLANALVSTRFVVFLLLLAGLCFMLGSRNDWAILTVFETVLSLQAIVTFGLIAPVLKIVHEAGHILAATRYGVSVRKAGINLIGFFPMPFVDCTEADISAARGQRIVIGAAGIFVDVTIGLLAFAAWHVVQGDFLRTLLGNVFMFSTLNSLLFNANPLIKLDGYFILADALGRRNLYTAGSRSLKEGLRFGVSLGGDGAFPGSRFEALSAVYALAAFCYRVNILFVISMALIPQYLGLGALAVAWGGYVMFAAPLLQGAPAPQTETGPQKPVRSRRQRFVPVVLAGLLAGGLFVPLPFQTVTALNLDTAASYQVSVQSSGFVEHVHPTGPVEGGALLLKLSNPSLHNEEGLLLAQLKQAEAAYEHARASSPADADTAFRQVASLAEQARIAASKREALASAGGETGTFIAYSIILPGTYLSRGTAFGAVYPSSGAARLTGDFPERYVTKFQGGVRRAELRFQGRYSAIDPASVTLQAIMSFDRESGARTYVVKTEVDRPAQSLLGQPGELKLVYAAEPLWSHIAFWFEGLVANLRESELVERSNRLDETKAAN